MNRVRFALAGRLRPAIGPFALNLATGLFVMAAHNATFWSRLPAPFDGHPVKAAVFAAMVFAVLMLVIQLLAIRWVQKPVLIALLLIGAVTSFYQDRLGITIDRDMIQNAMVTTAAESKHLITLPFLGHVLLFGVMPALLVALVHVQRTTRLRAALIWAGSVAGAVALFAGLLFSDAKVNMGTLREHKEILAAQQPLAPLSGAFRYARMVLKSARVEAQPLGRDAKAGPWLAAAKKPVLLVIWAGETTRAQNWGLNGYARDTTPELARRGVVNFTDVTSCGTATATSLPCMFSHLTQAGYSYDAGLAHENLLDVLRHAGFRVEWWDNNTGHKGLADRAQTTGFMIESHRQAEHCGRGECTDAVFLDFLRTKAATVTEDTVLVLHQIGSHGPSYFLRYPKGMAGFTPACDHAELTNCTAEELTNAYDNTILYSDWVMGQTIDILSGADNVLPAMIYVSDHGESLGENGLYLHGAPWFMAPEEQIKVPMVIWQAPRFEAALGVPSACLARAKDAALSHDNLFPTVLGMLDVVTSVRDPALDLTEGCRGITG